MELPEKEKMLAGELYGASDPQLPRERRRARPYRAIVLDVAPVVIGDDMQIGTAVGKKGQHRAATPPGAPRRPSIPRARARVP